MRPLATRSAAQKGGAWFSKAESGVGRLSMELDLFLRDISECKPRADTEQGRIIIVSNKTVIVSESSKMHKNK